MEVSSSEQYKQIIVEISFNRWVLDMQCGGSRNFMSALRYALENDEEQKHNVGKKIELNSFEVIYSHLQICHLKRPF